MERPPKWFVPVSVAALVWNLLGCAAYLMDVRITPEDVARMTAAEQALYHARPAWAVGATATAVWFGAAGSLALVLRRRPAVPLLVVSLAGVVAQNVWLFLLSGAAAAAGPAAPVLQSLVLVIAVALVVLARRAAARGWLSRGGHSSLG